MKLEGMNLWGKIIPCLTSFAAQCGNFFRCGIVFSENSTFCLLLHSNILPAVLPSTIYLVNLSSASPSETRYGYSL